MEWIKCSDRMPSTIDTNDAHGTMIVMCACEPGSREEGLIQVDIMNAVYFTNHWRQQRYSHWMYCPDPPKA